ncbi:MAG: malonic semialdehyde reductase [Rickettsiaceae bacterium]|nr:malonic semialdehyde reductase [Rickettsiaceae bacterium]
MLSIKEIFEEGRTCNLFSDKEVEDSLLVEIYNLMKLGPTSGNCSPLRIIFAKSSEQKQKVISTLMEGNVEKTKSAAVIAIFAYDASFFTSLPKLFPHNSSFAKMFETNQALSEETAQRNSALQAAYFITIARSLGLDTGPMSGFDSAKLNEAFFAGTNYKVNFICNLGYKAGPSQYPRLPRLDFDEACKIV